MSKASAEILRNRIERVIDIHRTDDALMLNIEIIGVLELVKLNIYMESQDKPSEKDEA